MDSAPIAVVAPSIVEGGAEAPPSFTARSPYRLRRHGRVVDLEVERLRRREAGPRDPGERVRRDLAVVVADERAEAGAAGHAPLRRVEAPRRHAGEPPRRASVGARRVRKVDELV